jgi:SAM-dependent methyltransferase
VGRELGDPQDTRRRFGRVFDGVAAAYDDVRSGYPIELVDSAIERGGLHEGSRVLEIGSGTGKLTELLVGRGLVVEAVDPGPNMIDVARRRVGETSRVNFRIAKFEELELAGETFAAVFSATAFHWVDPEIGWEKAAAALDPGGLLALLTHVGVKDKWSEEIDDEFLAVVRKHAPDVAEGWAPPRDLAAILAGVEERRANASQVWDWVMGPGRHDLAIDAAADLFEAVDVVPVLSSVEQTAEESVALLRTTSLYFRIDPERRSAFEDDNRRLVERLGGTLHFTSAAVLMTARAS